MTKRTFYRLVDFGLCFGIVALLVAIAWPRVIAGKTNTAPEVEIISEDKDCRNGTMIDGECFDTVDPARWNEFMELIKRADNPEGGSR